MRIMLDGNTYDVDPAPLLAEVEKAIASLADAPEYRTLVSGVRALAGTALGALAMKRPELRKPEGVDTLQWVARLLASALETYLEEHPVALTLRQGGDAA